MLYARFDDTDTNIVEYPFKLRKLQDLYPNVSFPRSFTTEALLAVHVREVTTTPKPAYDPATQKVIESQPAELQGVLTQVWIVTSLSQAEQDAYQTAQDARTDRDSIVNDSTIRALLLARPAQIENWINSNVNDLASAKDVLIRLAKALSLIVKREF